MKENTSNNDGNSNIHNHINDDHNKITNNNNKNKRKRNNSGMEENSKIRKELDDLKSIINKQKKQNKAIRKQK